MQPSPKAFCKGAAECGVFRGSIRLKFRCRLQVRLVILMNWLGGRNESASMYRGDCPWRWPQLRKLYGTRELIPLPCPWNRNAASERSWDRVEDLRNSPKNYTDCSFIKNIS